MITVWGGQTSRSIWAVWVLEEMGLPTACGRWTCWQRRKIRRGLP